MSHQNMVTHNISLPAHPLGRSRSPAIPLERQGNQAPECVGTDFGSRWLSLGFLLPHHHSCCLSHGLKDMRIPATEGASKAALSSPRAVCPLAPMGLMEEQLRAEPSRPPLGRGLW